MVGVPGRSKGCNTCRKRKKGCDKHTPICHQCIKAGLSCEGYGRDLVWVHATHQADTSSQSAGASQPPVVDVQARPWSARYAKQAKPGSQVALCDSLVRTAREQLYLGHYWSTWLPNGRPFSPEATNLAAVGWTTVVTRLYDEETTLRYVSVALAMAILARDRQDSQLLVKAFHTYNKAVQELGHALRQPDSHKRDGLIAAARLMAAFELLFVMSDGPQVLAWRGHSEGQQAMFLARGPEAFTTGAAHQLLVDSRANVAILAIGRRKTSPFNSHAWKTIPWTVHKKSAVDRLMDIMLDFSAVLEQVGLFQTCTSDDEKELHQESIFLRCQELEADLGSWAESLGADISKFDYTVVGLPLPMPKDDTEFALLHLGLIYRFNYMMLYSVMSFVCKQFNADYNKTVEKYASKNAYAVPLLFERSAGGMQNASGLLVLSIGLRFYAVTEPADQRSKEAKLLRKLFDREMAGTTIGRILERLHGGQDPLPMDGPKMEIQAIDRLSWF